MRTDTGHPKGDVLDLAAVGDGTELDDRVERDLQPRQVLLRRLQEVPQQTSKRKANAKVSLQRVEILNTVRTEYPLNAITFGSQ